MLRRLFGEGDQKNFISFFKDHYQPLCYFARKYVGDKASAEDIVSECFIRIWEKWGTLDANAGIRSYLYKSVYNASLRSIEQTKRREEKLKSADDVVENNNYIENIIKAETLREIHTAVDLLPKECKKVFLKLYIEGKTVKETAEELSISISTVKSQKARGLQLLKSRLSPYSLAFLLAGQLIS